MGRPLKDERENEAYDRSDEDQDANGDKPLCCPPHRDTPLGLVPTNALRRFSLLALLDPPRLGRFARDLFTFFGPRVGFHELVIEPNFSAAASL